MESQGEKKDYLKKYNIESLYLLPGTKIKLIKRFQEKKSDLPVNSVLEGILDNEPRIGQPIFLNGKSKNTSPISDVVTPDEGKRIFFKTSTSTYELVPPIDNIEGNFVPDEYKQMETKIENYLKEAQSVALPEKELSEMFYQRDLLFSQTKTEEDRKVLNNMDKELGKRILTVKTLSEFKILLNKLNKNYYFVMGTLAHENAHANKAQSLGSLHSGYSIAVYKKNDGSFGYQPFAWNKDPSHWGKKQKIENKIKMTYAPEEYGNKLSPGDEKRIQELRQELEDIDS